MALRAIALNCSLSHSPAPSSTEKLLQEALAELRQHGVEGESLRMVDYEIRPGVTSDEGAGDAWPEIRQRVLEADIVLVGTPTWLGHHSSVCQRVLERMDAFLGELDDQGRMVSYGRVAAVIAVGNEDGAHNIVAQVGQALNDVGFTLAAGASTYWNGEAMHKTDYKDLSETPKNTASATASLARNAAHLAQLLRQHPYPGS